MPGFCQSCADFYCTIWARNAHETHAFCMQFYSMLVSVLKYVKVSDVTGGNMKLQCLNDVTDVDDDLSDEAKVDHPLLLVTLS